MKKLLIFKLCLFYTLISVIVSCSTVQYTTTKVQTLNPPEKNISLPNTANIAIVALYSDDKDSLNITNMAMSLKTSLEMSPKYSSYIFPVYTVNVAVDDMNDDRITELRETSGADFLIAVENFNLQAGDKRTTKAYNFLENYNYTVISLSNMYGISFKIYDTHKLKLIDSNQMNDTVYLVANKYSWESEEEVLPDKKNAAALITTKITESYAKTIAPYWQEEIRYYYLSYKIDLAKEYIDNEEWDEAMKLWMRYVDDENKTLAAVCCFNMALGCEMIGEYELAMQWFDNVKKKDSKYYWNEYRNTLEKRIAEKKLIDNALR